MKEFVTTVLGIDTNKTSWAPHITHSWLNIYKPNHYDPPHNHNNCIISGVFYINCLELPNNETDGICFHRHHLFQDIGLPATNPTEFSSKKYRIPVVTGDLILFPSMMHHSVEQNVTTDQTRISLAFNTFFFGVLGDYESTSELILKQGK